MDICTGMQQKRTSPAYGAGKTGQWPKGYRVEQAPYPGGCQETSGNENSDLLIRLGVRANLKGFAYLKTAVKICRKDRGELDGITKRLYPSIAKIYGTSADKVEQSIRHAIRTSWDKGGNEEQRHVFGYCCGEGKRPTNAEFIGHVADHLDQMEKMLFS